MNKCDICNFSTTTQSNLTRHFKTNKHIENAKKKEHRIKTRKENTQKKLEDTKDLIISNLQQRLDDKDKEIGKYADLFKMQFEILKGQTEATNKSMSAIKYLSKYRTTAPVMKPLKGRELTKMITYKGSKYYTLADIVVHNYKHKTLHKFLGDMIIDKYKTDEPDDQSVWLSDLSRLSFIIRELKDGNPEWVTDKSGIKLTKLIISPMMKKVKEMLLENISDINNKNNEEEVDDVEIKENVQMMEKTNEIIRDINMNKFDASILKHIAPDFNLDIK